MSAVLPVDTDSRTSVGLKQLSRRAFLVQSALASCGIRFALAAGSDGARVPSGDAKASLAANIWVTLHGDGAIEIVSPGIELGQGTMTALALLLAEELDADWGRVRVIAAPADAKRFGNPMFWDQQLVGGSRTLCGYADVMRLAGAQARYVLLTTAARQWNVKKEDLTTENSVVSHRPSGRRANYGELASIARVPSKFPAFVDRHYHTQLHDEYFGDAPPSVIAPGPGKEGALSLKSSSQFKLIGVNKPRVDVPLKVNGSARYGLDAQIPDMHYAMVETGPSPGAAPETVDAAAARATPGIVAVLTLPYGVAVVGKTIFAVQEARNKLKISWRADNPAQQYNGTATLNEYSRIAAEGKSGQQVYTLGDAKKLAAALSGPRPEGVQRIAFAMQSELVYHAPLEPQNATVRLAPDGKSAEVWVGTQYPIKEAETVGAIVGIPPDNVTVNMFFTGGAFGRRSEPGAVIDAAHIVKQVRKPVKVIWTREDDIKRNPHRQSLACHVEAAFTQDGNILATRHRVVADSWLARFSPDVFAQFNNQDPGNWIGATHTYDVPHQSIESWTERRALDVCYLRGVSVTQIKFAQECLIDQIAHQLGQDPLEYRLRLVKSQPRGIAVLQEVARMSGWSQRDRKAKDRALGIAYMCYANAHGALVADVSLDRSTGAYKVNKFWAVLDAGLAVQPDGIIAQVQGGIIQGMSIATRERITVKNGVTQQTNFHEYPILRMSETPDIEAKVISTDIEICGASEIGVPQVAPAINNALAQLIGKHLTRMPMLPADVLQTLKST